MNSKSKVLYENSQKCVDDVVSKVGNKIVLGIPLGLGKPNHFVNELYKKVKNNSDLDLQILSALTLEKPIPKSEIENRLMGPILKRIFGDFPELEYLIDLRKNRLPANVTIIEFYTKAGSFLKQPHVQQNYISSNYTHVCRDIINAGINVAGQLIAKKNFGNKILYSASCNADTTLELGRRMRQEEKKGRKIAIVGQVNDNLPFMYGDAVVEQNNFDFILDNPEYNFKLFGPPRLPVSTADYIIGLYAGTLIKDGGTLQIGIGALGDALVYNLIQRHEKNDVYMSVLNGFNVNEEYGTLINGIGGLDSFDKGLYGNTEMFVEGFLHLYKRGIIKRRVYNNYSIQKLLNENKISEKITPASFFAMVDNGLINKKLLDKDFDLLQKYGIFKDELKFEDGYIIDGLKTIQADFTKEDNISKVADSCLASHLKHGMILHGSFFIGSGDFYEDLRNLSEDESRLINMTGVEYVNHLYGSEELKRVQRKDARFINTGMKVTLSGAVVSDGLDNGIVVSGVGGQYNFVSMAHALEDGRSIIMIKSTRTKDAKVSSNILFNYGHITIPRHLRDIVITEYGIADLYGRSDKEIIASLLNVTDSRFQAKLLKKAKKAKKIESNYKIPDRFRSNYPQKLEEKIDSYKKDGLFPIFPFGCDLTKEELLIAGSLKQFKNNMKAKKISYRHLKTALKTVPSQANQYLERLKLDVPCSIKEKIMQKVVVYALVSGGKI